MRPLHLLFGFRGRLERTPFVIAFLSVVAGFWALRQLAMASLPWLGSIFGPRGINAGFILNGILAVLWVAGVWIVLALLSKRLHDRGHPGWWAALAVLPLVALVMLNDEIVLVSSRFVLPSMVQQGILVGAGIFAAWVVVQTLVLPGND